MWEAATEGRNLNFHLAGINNQNFIMRDVETGSWWQQVTGEAILGPLKGRRLRSVFHDQLSFGIWKMERPQGRVLRPSNRTTESQQYAPADWEERMVKVPVVLPAKDTKLDSRSLVIGISINKASKAYPLSAARKQSPILDTVDGIPLVILVHDDGKSIRAYERTIAGRKLEFFVKPHVSPLRLVDAETGSEWDFTGKALNGPLSGHQLKRVSLINEYWFDWKAYHPDTTVYNLGN